MPENDTHIPGRPRYILLIYLVFFCFFFYKVAFYSNSVGHFPDEIAHISYIGYLDATHAVIPDFKAMTILTQKSSPPVDTGSISDRQGYSGTFVFSNTTNYLGHPPLYYQIMRLSGGVEYRDGIVTIDIVRLRAFSWVIAALALLLIFYIGYSRLGSLPLLHLLYAAICTSVPMLAYDSAGVNNDTLALLGVSIYLFGMLRFAEKKQNYYTYLLVSIGFMVSLLAKLTAGMMVVLSVFAFLLFYLIKEKNLRFLLSWKFPATIPLYLIVVAYFLTIHAQTGSFQPSLDSLNPQQYYSSGFYIQPTDRTHMDFYGYSAYFLRSFSGSWTGISSHIALLKNEHIYSLGRIGLILLWVLPLLVLYPFHNIHQYSYVDLLLFSIYLSLIITAAAQFQNAYQGYQYSGYLGGFQSRYYLCTIAAIGLATTLGVKKLFCLGLGKTSDKLRTARRLTNDRTSRNLYLKGLLHTEDWRHAGGQVFSVFFSALLIYEDFVYLALHFKQYF